MALQNKIDFKGLLFNTGYLKVVKFSGDKNNLTFIVAFKPSKKSQIDTYEQDEKNNLVSCKANVESSAIYHKEFTIPYDIDGDNPIKQAYTYLKTIEEFSDAISV